MTASVLWSHGQTSSVDNSDHALGTIPAGSYGSPMTFIATAGLAHTPNGGSLVESPSWHNNPWTANVGWAAHYQTRGTPSFFSGGNATHYFNVLSSFVSEHDPANPLNNGGEPHMSGDAVAQIVSVAMLIHLDDALVDGPPPTINSTLQQTFSGVAPMVANYRPVGNVTSWAVHSVSGDMSVPDSVGNTLSKYVSREVGPFGIAVIQGHSNDTPPYSTPDFVNGFTDWSLVSFQQLNHYFVGVAFWLPSNPSSPDYSYSFSGFPTSDFGGLNIWTLFFPPLLAKRGFAGVIG
jgi:hypothetical protein